MITLNSDISTSWGSGNKTGALVLEILKNQFNDLITGLNTSVTDIKIEEGATAGQVKYTITLANGTTRVGNFSLISEANYQVYLDIFDLPEYVAPGENVQVQYGFRIQDDSGVFVQKQAILRVTLTNGTFTYTKDYTTATSYAQDKVRTGYINIDGTNIKEGVTLVKVLAIYRDATGAETTTFTLSDTLTEKLGENDYFTFVSFNLKLSAVSETSLTQLISKPSDTLKLNFSFANGLGTAMTGSSNLTGGKPINTVIYNNGGSAGPSTTGSSYETTLATLSGTSNTGAYAFYVRSYVDFTGVRVWSNVVKYQYVGNTEDSAGTIVPVSRVLYAYKIDNYTNVSGATINTNSNNTQAEQYSTFELPIYAYVPADKTFTFKVNGTTITSLSIPAKTDGLVLVSGQRNDNPPKSWSYLLENSGSNTITLSSDSTFTLIVNTTAISGALSLPDNPVLKLTSNGKSGKDEVWGTDSLGNSLTSFTGFDWSSNGWIQDSQGKSALVINNNATAVINIAPCSKAVSNDAGTNVVTGRTVTFRFLTSNENTEEVLISCYNDNKDGFKIYPQKAVIYRGTQSIETVFSSLDSMKEVTFVWYNSSYGSSSIIYVNGTSLMVLTKGTSTVNNALITLTANESSLYLYNVEVYEKPLTFGLVLALSNAHDASNVANYAKANAIFSTDVTLGNNGLKVTIDSLPVGSSYLLIKAHPNGTDKPWEAINNLDATKKIDGKDTETKSWRLLAGETYFITKVANGATPDPYNFYANRITLSGQGTSSMSYPVKNFRIYFAKKITPAITCLDVDGEKVKGTGNLEGFGHCYTSNTSYNLTGGNTYTDANDEPFVDGAYGKTTMLKRGSVVSSINYHPSSSDSSDDYFYKIREDSIPANVFCLKADYAESSGVHNTGFARLANLVMENSANIAIHNESQKLPLNSVTESAKAAANGLVCRSTIDGRPIYLFFADKEGNITYHGKYNFNNEKASPEIFGFQPFGTSLKSFMSYEEYTSKNKTASDVKGESSYVNYFENSTVKAEAANLKGLFGLTDDSYERGHMYYKAKDDQLYINPTECWEFSTNDAADIEHATTLGTVNRLIGAFVYPYTIEDGVKVEGYPYSNDIQKQGLNPFTEKCMSEGKVKGLAWINTEQAWEPRYPDDDFINEFYEDGGTPYLLRSVYKWLHKHNVYCWSSDYKEAHAAEFALNLHKYFNVNFIIKYYVMTKLFINADQRVKNCMLAFFCDPNAEDNRDAECPMGHMRGFYIFYDNDTILGVTNTGSLGNPWNAKETHEVFLGIDSNDVSYHALWGNIEYCYNRYLNNDTDNQNILNLGLLVETAYKEIRNIALDTTIAEYLNSSLPDAAQNIDLEVKYLYPSTIAPNSTDWNASSIGQYQGNRKYHRDWLLNKRTKWFDAKYGAGSINEYQLDFKIDGASADFNSGTMQISPEFDEWRFYLQAGDAGIMTPTAMLNKDLMGTLTLSHTINSNVYHIKGLYGANKIDLSNWCGMPSNVYMNTINTASQHKAFPYLREFILGHVKPDTTGMLPSAEEAELAKYRFIVQVDLLDSLFTKDSGSTSLVLMPNLEKLTLLNLTSHNGGIFEVNLSKLTKLLLIDTSDTWCNIVLPNGSSLTKLIMKSPTSLEFINKTNLTDLTILDLVSGTVAGLESITATHCSNYIYQWTLDYALKNYAAIEEINITFGSGTDKDSLSSTTITKLVEVARLILNNSLTNITIEGKAYCLDGITSELSSVLYQAFGNRLTIDTSSGANFEFSYAQGKYLSEGSQLNINVNRPSGTESTYTLQKVSGDDAAFNALSIDTTNSTPYLCIVKAATLPDNTSRSCTFTVKTICNEVPYTSEELTVNYVAISSVKLTTSNSIISGNTLVSLELNETSTKNHLLVEGENILVTLSSGNYDYVKTNNLISGLLIRPANNTDDITISLNVYGKTDSLILFMDVQVCTADLLSTTASLTWLKNLIGSYINSPGLFNDSSKVMRSDLNKYTLKCTSGGFSISIGNGQPTTGDITDIVLDLTAVAYFKPDGTEFTIPSSFPFNNLNIPEGITSIDWSTINISNGGSNATSYENIMFPSTASRVRVVLTFDIAIPKLKFDISRASLITKIYNHTGESYARSLPVGVFSLSLTGNSGSACSKDQILFNYNGKITLIGNYSSTLGTALVDPTVAMFNITGGNDYILTFDPLYNLGAPININTLNIGYITSYKIVSSTLLDWNTISTYVTGLYYTFYKNNGTYGLSSDNILNLPKVTEIGDGSFFGVSTLVKIVVNKNVTSIGTLAFKQYTGIVTTSGSDNVVLEVADTIAAEAFAYLTHSHNFTLNSPSITLKNYAFYVDAQDVSHTITLNSTSLVDPGTSPFGLNKKNNLIVTNSTLKTSCTNAYGTEVNIS